MCKPIRCLLILVCLFGGIAPSQDAAPAGCYISTGDNDWLWESPPVQSPASIEAVFDSLQKAHGVDRIYWRGFQSECIVENFLVRPENFTLSQFWMWEKHLAQEVGTSTIAIEAAHQRGITIWGYTALFDHGAQACSDAAKGIGPSPIEHRLRAEHPEVVPVDRHAIRRQAGPMEFAYPEVRKTLVEGFARLVEQRNYDGLMFYTYVEHLHIWFQDECGFNDVIVEEFKRRYGQDIRTEEFDRHAWYRLRGEYVTQFLRELKVRLRASGKKLGVAIDPQNTHFPAPWLCVKPRDFLVTGRIHLDWERWVREGIVDEIMVYCGGSTEAAINDVLAVTNGTPCAVSTVRGPAFLPQHQHFARAGVRNTMSGAYAEIERGYPAEQTVEALKGADPLAKLRALYQVATGKLDAPAQDVIALLKDTNPLVRRQAIRAVVARKDATALPAVEAALDDPEHAVRCMAAEALATIHGPDSPAKLFAAIRAHGNFQFLGAATTGIANLPAERTPDILKGLAHQDVRVRRVTAAALGRGLVRTEAAPALLKAMSDPDDEVRFHTARTIRRFSGNPAVIDQLIHGLADKHPTVRSACAVSLGPLVRSHSRWLGPVQSRAFQSLAQAFRACGANAPGTDAEWTFRPIGNALLQLGPHGREVLEDCLTQRTDLSLADRAWRVLYVPVTGFACVMADEREARRAYPHHPRLSPTPRSAVRNPKSTEPATMPYLLQNFDSFKPSVQGNVGDYLSDAGEWRTFGQVHPNPVIQDKVRRGEKGNAVRLRRCEAGAAHNLDGLRADYRLTTERTTVGFWVYRQDNSASFCAIWKESGSGQFHVGLLVKPGGQVAVISGDRRWQDRAAKLPADTWQQVRFEIDPAKGRYSVYVGDAIVAEGLPVPGDARFNQISIGPQPPEGGVVYVDDVSVTVPNQARK